jgi:hypothetical protein
MHPISRNGAIQKKWTKSKSCDHEIHDQLCMLLLDFSVTEPITSSIISYYNSSFPCSIQACNQSIQRLFLFMNDVWPGLPPSADWFCCLFGPHDELKAWDKNLDPVIYSRFVALGALLLFSFSWTMIPQPKYRYNGCCIWKPRT